MIRRITLISAATALLAAAAQIPRPAGDLTINLNGGKRLQLSSYKGKPVVLAFILTTCSHCQATTRLLVDVPGGIRSRGLQVVESAIDQGGGGVCPAFHPDVQYAIPGRLQRLHRCAGVHTALAHEDDAHADAGLHRSPVEDRGAIRRRRPGNGRGLPGQESAGTDRKTTMPAAAHAPAKKKK